MFWENQRLPLPATVSHHPACPPGEVWDSAMPESCFPDPHLMQSHFKKKKRWESVPEDTVMGSFSELTANYWAQLICCILLTHVSHGAWNHGEHIGGVLPTFVG